MGKIIGFLQNSSSINPSGIEILLDSNEKLTIGNSTNGIRIYEPFLVVFPKLLWSCDNPNLIEKCFPILKTQFIGSPIEKIASEIIKRFKTKNELLHYLINHD